MDTRPITETRFNAIWETVCYLGAGGEIFTTGDVEKFLVKHQGFKRKTAQLYFNRFARHAIANPEEFSGPKSKLIRLHQGMWRLGDNPER